METRYFDEGVLMDVQHMKVYKCCKTITDIEVYDTPVEVKNAEDIHAFLLDIAEEIGYREHLYLICLNNANAILAVYDLFSGGISGSVIDHSVILRIPLIIGCNKIIIAHNHPSGNLKESEEDIKVTKKLLEGGKLLNVKLLDSIIFTRSGYNSIIDKVKD